MTNKSKHDPQSTDWDYVRLSAQRLRRLLDEPVTLRAFLREERAVVEPVLREARQLVLGMQQEVGCPPSTG